MPDNIIYSRKNTIKTPFKDLEKFQLQSSGIKITIDISKYFE